MSVQALVEQRLRQLADTEKTGTKIKSLRGDSVEILVPNHVKWSHKYSYPGEVKNVCHMTSCPLVSGWLAFVAS